MCQLKDEEEFLFLDSIHIEEFIHSTPVSQHAVAGNHHSPFEVNCDNRRSLNYWSSNYYYSTMCVVLARIP